MAYGLRKINKDFTHHGFQWPSEVGATVKCPDWNPEPVCGGGLHFLPNAEGVWGLLDGHYWCVIEYDEDKAVHMDGKSKVEECKIVFLNQEPKGLIDFFNITDSKTAYKWAQDIGDRNIMIDKVTDQKDVFHWAYYLGDRDVQIDKITESEWAYFWARDIGNRDVMIDRITTKQYAYYWAKYIGDRNLMISRFPIIEHMLRADTEYEEYLLDLYASETACALLPKASGR